MKRWTTPQAYMMRGAMNRAIANGMLLLKKTDAQFRHEVEADLALFGKMKKEAEDALKGGSGVWRQA